MHPNPESAIQSLRVVIIGAGMAGVLMGIRLEKAGVRDFVILEKGDAVGGTWRENRYPGLHCDFPSHVYRYSFHANPEWTSRFAPGPEIREYFENAARTFGVFDRVRFGHAVTDATWHDDKAWRVRTADGSTFVADAVVAATGFLHVPRIPAFPGLSSFAGSCFHSTRWDDRATLDDRRVGIVGTGSTAAQLVCALVDRASKLSLFQRTPQWVARIDNPQISDEERAALRADPARMDALFQAHYQEMVGLADGAILARDPALRKWLESNVEENLATVRDPELREKLTPRYQVGCKRLVMSPSFYDAVQKPSCELVTEGIERIVPDGVVTRDGRLHPLDVLVLATGFDPEAYFLPMAVTGENGTSIDEVWKDGPVAYRSMTVPHMPNFFMIEGPFSPVGNVSAVLIAEWQAEYILQCLRAIASGGLAMAPDPQRTQAMKQRYREATRETLWYTGGCQSWYLDRDGFPILYPYTAGQFESEMKVPPDLAEYRVRELG